MEPTIILTLIGILAAPLLGYLAAARRLSGKVASSEAADLWEESRSIRQDYQKRIEELNKVIYNCQQRIDELERRNDQLYLENGNLKRMIEGHEATIDELRSQLHRVSEENITLRDENVKLRRRVTELESHG